MEYQKPIIEISDLITKFKSNHKDYRLDGPSHFDTGIVTGWLIDDKIHRVDGPAIEWHVSTNYYWLNHVTVLPQEQEQALHIETLKLESIIRFIDFVARCDIILL